MAIGYPSKSDLLQIYFDAECMLCRNLALLLQKTNRQQLNVKAIQELDRTQFQTTQNLEPRKLLVRHQETWYEDLDAWEFLLQEIPAVRSLAWMPVKIFGLQKTASLMKKNSERLRRLCWRC